MPKTVRDRSEKPKKEPREFHCVVKLADGTTVGSPAKGREGLLRFLQYAPEGEFESVSIRRIR